MKHNPDTIKYYHKMHSNPANPDKMKCESERKQYINIQYCDNADVQLYNIWWEIFNEKKN